jgi:hypothetical protein
MNMEPVCELGEKEDAEHQQRHSTSRDQQI